MPLLRFAEYKPDITDYEGDSTKNILNVIPQGDGYGPFPGFTGFAQILPDTCRGGFYAMNSDSTARIFAGTKRRLYLLDNASATWTDVSAGHVDYVGLSDNAQWQFAQTGSLVFATQGNAVLQVYNMATSSSFSAALGSPPQASYITVVGSFVVLSGLLASPFRIQWSGLADYNSANSWTPGINSSDFQDFPDGGVVRGVAGGDQSGIIFQDQIIRSMTYVAGSPVIFQISKMTQGLGLLSPYTIAQSGGTIYFYSGRGFYAIPPGGQPKPIGREKIDRTFVKDVDLGSPQLFMAAVDPRSSRIYFAYKSISGTSGKFDKVMGYDTLLERWFPISLSGQIILGLSQNSTTITSLDSIVGGSIDAMTVSLDDYATAVQPKLAQFDSTGVLGFFSGAPLEAQIQTAEQGDDETRLDIRGFRPITDASNVTGSLFYRDTTQATPTQSAARALSRIGRCDMMRDARYARFQIDIPAGATWTFAAGIVPDTGGGAQI